MAKNAPTKPIPPIKQIKTYIKANYLIRFDIVSLKYEWKGIGEHSFREFNENDLYCELLEKNFKVTKDLLVSIISSSWIQQYNPIEEYFTKLPKFEDERDWIEFLASFVLVEEEREYFRKHFKKWLVRVVASCLLPDYFNKQMLLFVGPQNNGKTSFQRFLCPMKLGDYFSEEMVNGKDELITLSQSFLILLDELSKLDKAGVEHVKQLMTKTRIRFRQPYAKTQSTFLSRSSFMGNTNKIQFLKDETGSIRFLCFNVLKIDFNYSQAVDMDKVWAEAYRLFKTGFDYNLTREDEVEIQENNIKYQVQTIEQQLIMKLFSSCDEDESGAVFLTAQEIANEVANQSSITIKPENVGKALTFLGFKRGQRRKESTRYPVYGYWVMKKSFCYYSKELAYIPTTDN